MKNSLATFHYVVTFFSDKDMSLMVTEEQYLKLKTLLNEYKFVEINENLYNTSDIKSMQRAIDPGSTPLGRIGDFTYYTQQEFDNYMAR